MKRKAIAKRRLVVRRYHPSDIWKSTPIETRIYEKGEEVEAREEELREWAMQGLVELKIITGPPQDKMIRAPLEMKSAAAGTRPR